MNMDFQSWNTLEFFGIVAINILLICVIVSLGDLKKAILAKKD